MPTLLNIETTSLVCSVGISRNAGLIALREDHSTEYSHSSLLTVFIEDTLKEAGIKPAEISAVAVSQGPGSYTGLRIGVSAAKGFCYALNIPLLAVDTMRALTQNALRKLYEMKDNVPPTDAGILFCPMIDARRMEVYYALFRDNLSTVENTRAQVVNENTFSNLLQEKKVVFFGNGAQKCREVIHSPNAFFLPDVWPSAQGMIKEAEQKFRRKEFVDLAYFEPFYLKDFVAGKPKVKGLYS